MCCRINPLSPHDALKHHFTSLKTDLFYFPTIKGIRAKIPMKRVYHYMATSNYLHPVQVENSRLVVDEDDNGKFMLKRVKHMYKAWHLSPLISSQLLQRNILNPDPADHDYCRF